MSNKNVLAEMYYLDLRRKVSVASGNAEQNAVELLDLRGIVEDGDVGGLGGSVHLSEHFLREGLCDSRGMVSSMLRVIRKVEPVKSISFA